MTRETGHRLRPPAEGVPRHRWLMLIFLALAQFSVILDITVVNVALPEISRALDLNSSALTWVITAYLVTFGGLLILGGRLADLLGRKAVFLNGLALFTVASLSAGLASSGAVLVTSRAAQGVGAALLSPAALSILTTEFTGKDRNRALGVWAAVSAAGAAFGVLLGGVLTSGPGWQWVFFINVPIGLVIAAVVIPVVPARPRHPATPLGVLAASVGTLGVALLIYGLLQAGGAGWGTPSVLTPIALGLLCGSGFVLVERRAATPLIPRDLITRPPLPGAVAVMAVAAGTLLGAYFLSSIYLQQVEQYSPLRTGLLFLPIAVATAAGAHIASRHVATAGPRRIAIGAMSLTAAGLAIMGAVGVGGSVPGALLPGFALAALGLGAAFVTAITTGLSQVAEEHSGVASGVFNTGHELGASLGVAVASAIAAVSIPAAAGVPLSGFQYAYFAAAAGAAVLAVAAPVLLPRGKLELGDRPLLLH